MVDPSSPCDASARTRVRAKATGIRQHDVLCSVGFIMRGYSRHLSIICAITTVWSCQERDSEVEQVNHEETPTNGPDASSSPTQAPASGTPRDASVDAETQPSASPLDANVAAVADADATLGATQNDPAAGDVDAPPTPDTDTDDIGGSDAVGDAAAGIATGQACTSGWTGCDGGAALVCNGETAEQRRDCAATSGASCLDGRCVFPDDGGNGVSLCGELSYETEAETWEPCELPLSEPRHADIGFAGWAGKVWFQLTSDDVARVPHVVDEQECSDGDGWYFLSGQEQIALCPESCERPRANAIGINLYCPIIP